MRMTSVAFDDDEQPEEFAVVMTLDELALLYRLCGHVPPRTISERFGDVRWGNTLDDLAIGSGNILNRFFEEGVDAVIPKPRMSGAMA